VIVYQKVSWWLLAFDHISHCCASAELIKSKQAKQVSHGRTCWLYPDHPCLGYTQSMAELFPQNQKYVNVENHVSELVGGNIHRTPG